MSNLFWQDRKVRDSTQGLKLINFDKGKLQLSDEGAQLLGSLDPNANANLVFIFGNARSGKSFMMNCLVGMPGVFKVINSSQPCTRGVDISSFIGRHKVFARHYDVDSDERVNPYMGFVDVEGQGAEDGTYDTMLALPLLLTSKVCLFNHKGAPTVSDMLSKLGVLARAADYIQLEDDNKGDEDGHTGKKKFGHLHVLFRDFAFDGDKESVYEQLMGMEKVHKSLKTASGALDQAKAARERNDIRQMLLDNFGSINVHLFKQPANADDLKQFKELPANHIDPEFSQTVEELASLVTEQCATPTYFNGKRLTGPRLAQLISQVTAALNEGGVINVPSVYRAMEKETVSRVANECMLLIETVNKQMRAALPLPSAMVDKNLSQAKDKALAKYDADLVDCPLEDEKKTKKEEMLNQISKIGDEIRRDNHIAMLQRIKKVISDEMGHVKTEFEAYCKANFPIEEGKKIDTKFQELKAKGMRNCEAALSDIPETLTMNEYTMQMLESTEVLQEFLTMKTVENDSILKDRTIEILRREALERQKQLIEQNKKLEQFLEEEKQTTEQMQQKLQDIRRQRQEDEAKKRELQERLEAQAKELEEIRLKKKKLTCIIL